MENVVVMASFVSGLSEYCETLNGSVDSSCYTLMKIG
jgi:hypothetical protein